MKTAIIGGGNIGRALAEGLIRSGVCKSEDITITRRHVSALADLDSQGFHTTTDNAKAVKNSQAVFICVLPQQLDTALDEISNAIDLKNQLVVSVVTGAH